MVLLHTCCTDCRSVMGERSRQEKVTIQRGTPHTSAGPSASQKNNKKTKPQSIRSTWNWMGFLWVGSDCWWNQLSSFKRHHLASPAYLWWTSHSCPPPSWHRKSNKQTCKKKPKKNKKNGSSEVIPIPAETNNTSWRQVERVCHFPNQSFLRLPRDFTCIGCLCCVKTLRASRQLLQRKTKNKKQKNNPNLLRDLRQL